MNNVTGNIATCVTMEGFTLAHMTSTTMSQTGLLNSQQQKGLTEPVQLGGGAGWEGL